MLIGHKEQQGQFIEALSGRLHHAWLLAGPRGVGKRRFADAAALVALSGARTFAVDMDDPAARLVAAGSHLDHRILEREVDEKGREAGEIKVEQVRALAPLFRTRPGLGRFRTVIVDSIDDLNRAAANALLKNLEEPPEGTLFFLVSHAPDRLLPTIRSRCRILRFSRMADQQVEQIFRDQGVPDEEMGGLVMLARGAPGQALRFRGAAAGLVNEIDAVIAGGDLVAFARTFQSAGADKRLEALLSLAPARLLKAAHRSPSQEMFGLYDEAQLLAGNAVRLAYDRVQVAFALARLLARAGELEGQA